MKTSKKILSLVLSALLIFGTASFGSITAFAAEENGFTYEIEDGDAKITGYDENAVTGDIKIPETLGGYTVTAIGDFLFGNDENITSVIIPDSVTSIGKYAFADCSELTYVKLPANLTELSDELFSFCKKLNNLELPSSLTKICYSALYHCDSITEIILPPSVTELGDDAFGFTSITSIVLPSGLKTIPKSLFWNCAKLENVEIPGTVTEIGGYSFGYCESLKSLHIPSSVKTINSKAFLRCGLEQIEIPSSVTSIGTDAFEFCNNLKKVTVWNSECEIGDTSHTFFNVNSKIELCGYEGSTLQTYSGSYTYNFSFTKINESSHEHIYSMEETLPDCTNNGIRTYTCTVEGCSDSYSTVLPAYGHTIVTVPGKDATCTQSGLTDGGHCKNCDYKLEQEEIPAKGHTDENADGICDVCSAVLDENKTNDGCICHKGNIFSKLVRFFYSLISFIFGSKSFKCCGDMEFMF